MQTTELRTVIGSRLFSLLIPFHPQSPETRLWRDEIVCAGPMDYAVLKAVFSLEIAYAVKAVWTRNGEHGIERWSTEELNEVLEARRARVRRNRRGRRAG